MVLRDELEDDVLEDDVPKKSYFRRWSGSERTEYASLMRTNLSCDARHNFQRIVRSIKIYMAYLGTRVFVHIWMISHRKPLVCALDFLIISFAVNTKDGVVIFPTCGHGQLYHTF